MIELPFDPKFVFLRNRALKDRGKKIQPLLKALSISIRLLHTRAETWVEKWTPDADILGEIFMPEGRTSAPVQRYRDLASGDKPAEARGVDDPESMGYWDIAKLPMYKLFADLVAQSHALYRLSYRVR